MKLGRLLTQSELITESQLDEALNAQLIHGGHLGTCLIEREFITEEQLGEVLAQSFNVACAKKSVFDSVSRFVVGLLPIEMVEKHQAVPFHLTDDLLDIAMIDPKDLRAIDELAFASGRNVRAWIAPEIRILQAMDRYYGLTRRMRYVTLSRQLDRAAASVTGGDTGEIIHHPNSCEANGGAAVATLEAPAAVITAAAPTGTTTATAVDELSDLSDLLVRVAGTKKLGELAVNLVSETSQRVMLFKVNGKEARPWNWSGIELTPSRAEEMNFSITSEPIFNLVKGERHFQGPLPEKERCTEFFATLNIDTPLEVLLVPAYSNDRLIAMLYADDGGDGRIVDDISVYRRLMIKVGLALDLIGIKKRIRSS